MAPAAIPTRLKPNAPRDSLRVLANLSRDSDAEVLNKFLKSFRGVLRSVVVES